jgi:energy-coupling factor transport system permease protein
MSNRIIFGQYYDSNSWLHRIDPRTKLISLFLSILFLFIINNIYVLLGYTALLIVLIITTKVPIAKFFKSINMMTYIMIFTFVFQVINDKSGTKMFDWNFNLTVMNLAIIVGTLALWFIFGKYVKAFKLPVFILLIGGLFALQYFVNITPNIISYNIKIYDEGLIEATFIVLRIINFLFLSSLLTLTTKPTEINNGLDKLLKPLSKIGFPTASFSMMISVTLRYIPTLIHEADIVLKSQASRGADFKEVNFISKVFQMVSLFIPLFVLTYKKAYDLTFAMEARGYVDNKERSSIYELKYAYPDILMYIFTTLLFIFSIVSRFIF